MANSINLGSVTAYSIAVKYGFQGTEQEWMQNIMNASEHAEDASESASTAQRYAVDAENSAEEARVRYGSPLVASTVAGMTEENRVYVYTGSEAGYTSGNWYYYNGTAWVSGGVYNGDGINTDDTLTIEGMPADAKAVGDAINGLDELLGSGVIE